jgi:hypothetical protein
MDTQSKISTEELRRNPPVNVAWLLGEEKAEVQRLYEGRHKEDKESTTPQVEGKHTFGVALSGGGIRSASVCLGLIQGLAKVGILKEVHYMSGISGGGYILGWLTSWIRRSGFECVNVQLKGEPREPKQASPNQTLANHSGEDPKSHNANDTISGNPSQIQDSKHQPKCPDPAAYYRFLEPGPIRHLREYCAFLTPRLGLTSGDTLAMISIYLRNVLLNQTLILAVAACLTAVAQMSAPWISWRKPLTNAGFLFYFILGMILAGISGVIVGRALKSLGHNQKPREMKGSGITAVILSGLMGLCLWRVLPTAFLQGDLAAAMVAVAFAGVSLMSGWLSDGIRDQQDLAPIETSIARRVFASILAIVVAVFFLAAVVLMFDEWLIQREYLKLLYIFLKPTWVSVYKYVYVGDWYVILGLPAILLALALTNYVQLGILGKAYPDAKREWLARMA